MRRNSALWFVAGLFACGGLRADGFELVIYGAGVAGAWTTQLTLANRNADETTVGITDRLIQPCQPGGNCLSFASLSAHGTAVVTYPLPGIDNTVGAAYLLTGMGEAPSVLARAFVPETCATVDLPVFRIATLRDVNPTTLVLPGAVSGGHGRSNLILANVPDPGGALSETLTVGIEAVDPAGGVMGQSQVTVPPGETLFLQDVVAALTANELENGQLRVTKLAGDGVMWAIMPVTRADGSVSVGVGQAP